MRKKRVFELGSRQKECLSLLIKKDGKISITEIGEMLDMTKQQAHTIISALQKRGLIEKIDNPQIFKIIRGKK